MTDAYFLVYSGVLLVGGTLGQAVEVVTVPFAAGLVREQPSGLKRYLGRAALGTSGVALVAWMVAVPLMGFAGPHTLRGPSLTYGVLFLPLVLFWCAAGIYSGTLISQWEIGAATGSMLWRGAGALLGLGTVPFGAGLPGVAVGIGFGEACRLWWLRHRALRYGTTANTHGSIPGLGAFRSAAVAQVFAAAIGSAVPVGERLLAGGVGPGAISHLEYATRLLVVPTVLFDGALAPMLLARWTAQIGKGEHIPLPHVRRALGKGLLVAAACAVGLLVLAPEYVTVLLRHGRFSAEDAAIVAQLLRILAVGFVGSMGAMLTERLYLARAANRTLAVLSLARGSVRLALAIALLSSQHIMAFGFGYAGAEWVYLALLLSLLRMDRFAEPPEGKNGPPHQPRGWVGETDAH